MDAYILGWLITGVIAVVLLLMAYTFEWGDRSDDMILFIEKMPRQHRLLMTGMLLASMLLLGPIALARVLFHIFKKGR